MIWFQSQASIKLINIIALIITILQTHILIEYWLINNKQIMAIMQRISIFIADSLQEYLHPCLIIKAIQNKENRSKEFLKIKTLIIR